MTRKETPAEMAQRLAGEIGDGSQKSYTKGEVKHHLNNIAALKQDPPSVDTGCRAPTKVGELRRGDVFIATAIGGKVRPWIVLFVDDGFVSAVSLSTGDSAPNMTKSQCRYWARNWIGSTIAQFTLDHATQEVTRPYTNLVHLSEVQGQLIDRMRLQQSQSSVSSISEIRARLKGIAA